MVGNPSLGDEGRSLTGIAVQHERVLPISQASKRGGFDMMEICADP
jgi:hypothetical protein